MAMMYRWGCLAAALAVVIGAWGAPARAVDQSTPAGAAILIDLSSGATLLEKNADMGLPPASMSKLMTLYAVFEAIESGRVALSDEFRTTPRAASMGGSSMFLREGELVSIENLLRGVIVQSGNDAAVALAEALAGTEEAFAEHMNRRAAEIGMTNSHFLNATGWPADGHVMSVRDLAILSERLILDFPDFYPMFAEQEFAFDGRVPSNRFNRNPLLGLGIGADGLKTGHTEEAGYGLAASAKRGDRRVVLVVTGLESTAQRKQESERLINWAFRAFEQTPLYAAGETVVEAETWIGAEATVALAPARDVLLIAPFGRTGEAEVIADYVTPVEAPIEVGTELGRLIVRVPDMPEVSVPLVAASAVSRGGFGARFSAALDLLLGRHAAAPGEEG